jgi:hypothetical protein
MATIKYSASDRRGKAEYDDQGNEKWLVKAAAIDQRKFDKMLAKICSLWMREKVKMLKFQDKQRCVAKNCRGK